MRIGLSSNFIEPALTQGRLDGIGTFTQSLYQQLRLLGKEVVPVVFPPFKNRRPLCQLPQAELMSQPYPLAAAYSTFLRREMPGTQQLKAKIDLYHCTDYLIPRLKDIPVLAMIHDAIKVQYPSWNSSRLRRLKTAGLKKAIHWASHYIAPSRAVIPELVEYFGLDEKKISVIHNAISEDWLQKISPEEKQAALNKFQLRPDFLLFTGTLQPRKNIQGILKAIKSLPADLLQEHPLVMVGQRGWIDNSVLEEIQKLSEKGQVRWLNYVSTPELRALFQSAKLFLFPSLHEGFGLPILEAFASELPVITSNISAMPEVAQDAAYFVNPHESENIGQAIQTLLEKPELQKELILKGSQRVQDFSWKICREKILETYKAIL